MSDLLGRVALVTGGAGTIGSAICRSLADAGAIVIVADLRLYPADELATGLPHGRGWSLLLDVTDSQAWDTAVERILDREGRLDILVNNAATHVQALAEAMTNEEWSGVMRTNADAVFYGCRAAVRGMREAARGGSIVNIVAGQFGVPYASAYTASKFLVQGFSRCLALEVARYGIRVNTVAPGLVPHEGFEDWYRRQAKSQGMPFKAWMAAALDSVPLHRLGRPEDIAAGVLYLTSDDSRYVTGHMLDIGGGLSGYHISLAPEGGWPAPQE